VSVHPSGKVALSVGKDRTLYMWDLMRGRRAASMKLGFGESLDAKKSSKMLKIFLCIEGELVRWSTTGSMLIVQSQRNINVYSTVRYRYPFVYPCLTWPQELATLYTLEHASRIHDVKFVQRVDGEGEVLLVAAEDKKTTVYEVHPDIHTIMHPVAYLVGHKNRCVAEMF
jgi:protein MAK11